MPDPTYESEMSQPVHRPGMEGVVNRQQPAADADDEPRHTVSPPTRSAFGAASRSDPAPAAPAKPAATPAGADDSPGASRESQQRERTILKNADDQS